MHSWSLVVVFNIITAAAYVLIAAFIVRGLLYTGQLRRNRLAVATAAIFISCAAHHFLHAYDLAGRFDGPHVSMMREAMGGSLDVAVSGSTALIGVIYLGLRRSYSMLLQSPSMFDVASDARYRQLAANLPQTVVLVVDTDLRLVLAEGAGLAEAGYARVAMEGRLVADVLPPEAYARLEPHYRAAVGGGTAEFDSTDPATGRTFHTRARPLTDDKGKVVGGLLISEDVTGERALQAELAQARDAALEASRHTSAFLATMSHEIRTPMNAVIGMTGLLLDTRLDEEQRDFVETVRSSGDALLSIINDILDFSKIEAGGLRLEHLPFDLRDCVEQCLDLVAATAAAKGLELVGNVDALCPVEVVGDVTRLRQVLVNLLSNAVKFTGQGHVLLTVVPGQHVDGPVTLTFGVADTGIGIPPERVPHLFGSFTQVDASTTRLYGGTGLGLAISQRLVTAMGASVDVASVLGAGSTFSFSVALDVVRPAADPPAQLSGRSALVVAAGAVSRAGLRAQLEGWGMTVTEAQGLGDAHSLIDVGAGVDVVLLASGHGSAGADLAVRLRAAPGSGLPPILLLRSLVDPRGPDLTGRFASVLPTPTHSKRLLQRLTEALSPEQAPSEPAVAAPAPRAPEQDAWRSLRVLLAEDNLVNQKLARLMLEKLGHRVDVVGNGQEAVTAARQVPYDVVLMDIEMPEMDGLTAARAIRGDVTVREQPQIIALTASVLAEDRQACTAAGMDDYVSKPVHLDELDQAMRRAARTSAPVDAGQSADLARADSAALDAQIVDSLIAAFGDDGAELVAGLMQTYLTQSTGDLAALRHAADSNDLQAVGALSHKLQSATAQLGAVRLAELLRDTEFAARQGGGGVNPLVEQLDVEFALVREAMHTTMGRLPSTTRRIPAQLKA